MARPVWTLPWLALCPVVLSSGCVAKPPERYIVLRLPHAERRVHLPRHTTQASSTKAAASPTGTSPVSIAPKPEGDEPLSSEEKLELFRLFDVYRAGGGQSE